MLSDAISTSAAEATRLGPLLSTSRGGLGADAVFRVGTSPVILFKSTEESSDEELEWHRIAWNFGVAPLLWVTTPEYIRLYNAYQPPQEYSHQSPLLEQFPYGHALEGTYNTAEAICSRRNIAMGSFWKSTIARTIDRQSRVDNVLLHELGHLLGALSKQGLRPSLAQKLVGRCIFFQYLIHRGYLTQEELAIHFGAPTLHELLTDLDRTYKVFGWIKSTFNGDLFPIEDEASERQQLSHSHERLQPLSDFFGYFNVADGQGRLFPFRFDAIPVELISSIYEKFSHMSAADEASRSGIHYTPINLVDLVLDPVFENVKPDARVLDTACGSGVFLVESLRRLAWLRSRKEELSRELIGDILAKQVRGIDISPAALSVAAFSLYLALLELDPSPPCGIDALSCLKFQPLQDHVLFPTSAFEDGLEEQLSNDMSGQGFDIIVGNPPWTYNPKEKVADRKLAEDDRINDQPTIDTADQFSVALPRSGTTYARQRNLAIPARSADWPFLWRCRDFTHPNTRVALVMKATPFFSLAPATLTARDAVLRAFPNVVLVNLSQLRTSRLFQEYEEQEGDKKKRRRTAGPALLFLSNCLPANDGCVSVMDLPWSSTFNRTGVFELPADPPRAVRLDLVHAMPGLLKAATFGTDRDAWFLERIFRNTSLCPFREWLSESELPAGKGYQPGETMSSAHLRGLLHADARDARYGRLVGPLETLDDSRVHRAREPSLFRGPLVLLPEGSLTNTPLVGRYTAIFDERDIAFSFSFFGISFFDHEPHLARALAAVMHSRLVAYQLAYMGGTVGIKQTKIEVPDLSHLHIPRIEDFSTHQLEVLSDALDILTVHPQSPAALRAAAKVDNIVESVAGFSENDQNLLADVDRRAKAIFFETRTSRSPMQTLPNSDEIERYAVNVCEVFNAFAPGDEDHFLVPELYSVVSGDLAIVKLVLRTRNALLDDPIMRSVGLSEIGDIFLDALGGAELPYVKPAKALRLYVNQEIYILKPAQYRCFSPAAGQSDGDRIVADLMHSTSPGSQLVET